MSGIGVLHCQVWWINVPSLVADEFLWDAFDVECATMVEANSLLEKVRDTTSLPLGHQPASALHWRRADELPQFSIHPQRYRALHPLGKAMAQASQGRTECAFDMAVIQAAGDAFMVAQRQDMAKSCLRSRIDGEPKRDFTEALHLAAFYADFYSAGRNIFEFPSALTTMFSRTDITDIPLDLIRLPYRALYLSFGPQDALEVDPGWYADGAYVSMLGDRSAIQFALTCAPKDRDQYSRWQEHPEPVYVQAITKDRMSIGVGEAAELVFSDQLASLRKQMEKPGALPEGLVDATPKYASAELQRIHSRYAAWQGMLRLVVNALAYLSAYPDDIDTRWPQGTPQNLFLLTQDGTFKQKRNATSKLAELGYSEIHFCGRRVREQSTARSANGGDPSRTATWVRGHWKRQPYGPESSLRKLIWRMPVLRNAEFAAEGQVETGHIYLVS